MTDSGRSVPQWADYLEALSAEARRNVSGDFEWSAAAFRKVVESTRALCDAVDGFRREQCPINDFGNLDESLARGLRSLR